MTKNITESLAQMIEKGNEGLPLKSDVVKVGFKRLSDTAVIPTRAHESDSGFDLVANEDVIIEPGETVIVPTGIAVELPKGFEATVRPRSGVTSKTKLRVQLGTIDNSYRGEIGVIVDNIRVLEPPTINNFYMLDVNDEVTSEYGSHKGTYQIRKGDRIAQLVVQELPEVKAVEIDEFTQDSERGEGGFGSTGV